MVWVPGGGIIDPGKSLYRLRPRCLFDPSILDFKLSLDSIPTGGFGIPFCHQNRQKGLVYPSKGNNSLCLGASSLMSKLESLQLV